MKEAPPQRFVIEQEEDFFFVRDTFTNDRLPFKSHERSDIEKMLERLNSNYEDYRKRASMQ